MEQSCRGAIAIIGFHLFNYSIFTSFLFNCLMAFGIKWILQNVLCFYCSDSFAYFYDTKKILLIGLNK